jgi:multicomponent Na+:H+ antiporter subunit G
VSAADVIAAALVVLAGAFVLLAAVGLWRFEDLFSRIHAATKAVTLGLLLAVLAAALRVETAPDALKLLLAALLQLVSAPVSGHMLGRAAYRAGLGRTREAGLRVDELRDAGAPAERR